MTNSVFRTVDRASRATAEAPLEFGRFQVLLRQRLLLTDGVQIELGTRASSCWRPMGRWPARSSF
jgi:hypothetical protein